MNKPVFTIDVGGINTEEIYANAVMSREDSSRLRISCPDEVEKDEAPYSDHYKGFPFEPVDIAEAYQLNFNEGNIVKYLLRWRKKDGIKDLRKARYYIERLIGLEERRLQEAGE